MQLCCRTSTVPHPIRYRLLDTPKQSASRSLFFDNISLACWSIPSSSPLPLYKAFSMEIEVTCSPSTRPRTSVSSTCDHPRDDYAPFRVILPTKPGRPRSEIGEGPPPQPPESPWWVRWQVMPIVVVGIVGWGVWKGLNRRSSDWCGGIMSCCRGSGKR